MIVALVASVNDYTCGSPLLHPFSRLRNQIMCRSSTFIELLYYSNELGIDDLCCLCVQETTADDQNLKSKFLTVLQICESCCQLGKECIVARVFTK